MHSNKVLYNPKDFPITGEYSMELFNLSSDLKTLVNAESGRKESENVLKKQLSLALELSEKQKDEKDYNVFLIPEDPSPTDAAYSTDHLQKWQSWLGQELSGWKSLSQALRFLPCTLDLDCMEAV